MRDVTGSHYSGDLFAGVAFRGAGTEQLREGAVVLRGFAGASMLTLRDEVRAIASAIRPGSSCTWHPAPRRAG